MAVSTRVPVDVIRKAYDGSVSYCEMARRLGLDESRVRRIFKGRDSRRRGRERPIVDIDYALAVSLLRAMDVDPVDVGL